MHKKVLVPIANGMEELEVIGIIDTLRRAGANVTVASVQELQITGCCETKIIADKLISACTDEEYDMILDASSGALLHALPKYDLTFRILDELNKGVTVSP